MYGSRVTTSPSERIAELCSFGDRVTGTDAERRAANRLAERLRESGRRAEVEPILVQTPWAGAHALHCLLGIAGSLTAAAVPALGFGLVLLAATSMYLDLHGRRYLARRLAFRRSSQNVFSAGPGDGAGGRVILCANYDAPRTGAAYEGILRRVWKALAGRSGLIGPFRVLFWALALLLVPIGVRLAGVESSALDVVQLPSTLILIIGVFLLAEIELSQPGPGANDNASGVAAAIAAAERLQSPPPEQVRVDVLLTGGGEAISAGMRAYLRGHRAELGDQPVWFVALDAVGSGPLRYETSSGWVIGIPMDRRLIEISEAIASAAVESGGQTPEPWRSASGTESLLPAIAGYPAIGISRRDEHGLAARARSSRDRPELIEDDAVDEAAAFADALVRQLDRDRQRRSAGAGRPPPGRS